MFRRAASNRTLNGRDGPGPLHIPFPAVLVRRAAAVVQHRLERTAHSPLSSETESSARISFSDVNPNSGCASRAVRVNRAAACTLGSTKGQHGRAFQHGIERRAQFTKKRGLGRNPLQPPTDRPRHTVRNRRAYSDPQSSSLPGQVGDRNSVRLRCVLHADPEVAPSSHEPPVCHCRRRTPFQASAAHQPHDFCSGAFAGPEPDLLRCRKNDLHQTTATVFPA